jgi:hypothetical protein
MLLCLLTTLHSRSMGAVSRESNQHHQPAASNWYCWVRTVQYSTVQYSTVLYDRLLESSEHQIFFFSFAFKMKIKYGDDDGQHPLSLYSSPSLCRHHSLEGKLFVRLIVVLVYALSLSRVDALSLSHICSLSLARARMLSISLSPARMLSLSLSLSRMLSLSCGWSLSHGCSLSHVSPLSIYPVVCCRIHARRIFFFDDGVNMEWSCCRCPSIVSDMLVLLFVHASGFVHSSFICCNVL